MTNTGGHLKNHWHLWPNGTDKLLRAEHFFPSITNICQHPWMREKQTSQEAKKLSWGKKKLSQIIETKERNYFFIFQPSNVNTFFATFRKKASTTVIYNRCIADLKLKNTN